MRTSGRPGLPDASCVQRVFWGVAIGAATLLVATLGVRVADDVDLRQWWVPLLLGAGVLAADFASGLLHWAADTWGRADMPVIGKRILLPFRAHHVDPTDIVKRRFLDTNGDVAALVIPVLVGLVMMPLDSGGRDTLAVVGFGFCAIAPMTNQIHQWAHTPRPPQIVRKLQQLGLLLRPREHATHHDGRYDGHYCITTGWCNRPLEAVAFFRRLERGITCLTGARPRSDEQDVAAMPGRLHQKASGNG